MDGLQFTHIQSEDKAGVRVVVGRRHTYEPQVNPCPPGFTCRIRHRLSSNDGSRRLDDDGSQVFLPVKHPAAEAARSDPSSSTDHPIDGGSCVHSQSPLIPDRSCPNRKHRMLFILHCATLQSWSSIESPIGAPDGGPERPDRGPRDGPREAPSEAPSEGSRRPEKGLVWVLFCSLFWGGFSSL